MARVVTKYQKSLIDLSTIPALQSDTVYAHWCGERLRLITRENSVIGFAALTGTPITTCPTCLEVLEFDTIQLLNNLKELGEP